MKSVLVSLLFSPTLACAAPLTRPAVPVSGPQLPTRAREAVTDASPDMEPNNGEPPPANVMDDDLPSPRDEDAVFGPPTQALSASSNPAAIPCTGDLDDCEQAPERGAPDSD